MRAKLRVATSAFITLMFIAALPMGAHASGKGFLSDIGWPDYPGARLLTEINLPEGKRVDDLQGEYGSLLGLRTIKQVGMLVYSIGQTDSVEDVFKFYDRSIERQDWKTMLRSQNKGKGMVILYNEKMGMLIMLVDPPGQRDRKMTMLRIAGEMDASRIGDPGRHLPAMIREMFNGGQAESAAGIPIGQPISVPPSDRLHVKATRSNIKGEIRDGSTAEIRLRSRTESAGELERIDDRLVLSLTPRLSVDDIVLPGNVGLLMELTEGSLALDGSSVRGRSLRLNVLSTGASVTLNSIPLVSGTQIVKSVNGTVQVSLSSVEGGALSVEVTGDDITLALPRNASAQIKATTTSGRIQNLTDLTSEESSDTSMSLRMGAGRADISLRAVNGTVCIKYAD